MQSLVILVDLHGTVTCVSEIDFIIVGVVGLTPAPLTAPTENPDGSLKVR